MNSYISLFPFVAILQIILKTSEQVHVEPGDTIGYTITNKGNIPFDDDWAHLAQYCRHEEQYTEIGSRVVLPLDTGYYRQYSFQAIYIITRLDKTSYDTT